MLDPKIPNLANDGRGSTSVESPARLNASPMDYAGLLEHGCRLLTKQGMKPLQVKNLASALRGWVSGHGFTFERSVGEDFATDFDRLFMRYCDVISQRLAVRTQRDRQEQLLRWRQVAGALRQCDTLPARFSDALASALRASPLLTATVARRVGIDHRTLDQWSTSGWTPRRVPPLQLSKLESVLELPAGALVSRLPPARRARFERKELEHETPLAFTLTRRAQLKRVGHYALKPTSRLEAQWEDLLGLKTNPLREHARARNTWRLKPLSRVGFVPNRMMIFRGQVCATAGVQWNHLSCYLGWLTLPPPEGPGLPRETVDTLAWLADPDTFIRYVNWRIEFAGGKFHNGISCLFQLVESFLRPETGFLWLRPALRGTVSTLKLLQPKAPRANWSDEARWRFHCEAAREKLHAFRVSAADAMGIRMSRDPTERMTVVLNDEFPLKRLVEFVERLEASEPLPAHHRSYCVWIRDVMLCRLLMSNPLRISQYAAMTFRPDGTGNLVRVGTERYRMKFAPSDFKNEKGAASVPYDIEVDATTGKWIERYLMESRPHLVDAGETDRFLLASATAGGKTRGVFLEEHGLAPNKGWDSLGIAVRIRMLTRTYIDGCSGFGPHSFRHIIATDHLRRHPGDYPTVATLLHDRLETVLKCYGHLRVADGLRALSSGIEEAARQLASEREAR